MQKRPQPQADDEVVIDAESGEEVVAEETELAAASLQKKLKELRKELKEVRQERELNLAGWQRSKADLVNFRRAVEDERARDTHRVQAKFARALIPALDSFESAMQADSWQDVNEEWRQGVLRIRDQLTKGLAAEGLTAFGEPGEAFDPNLHECMSVVPANAPKDDHTIAAVLMLGYKIGNEIVRPAKVVVAQHNS